MKAKKAKKEAKPAAKPKRHIPRQAALPGMENSKIAAIENAALDYAEIRDQRQALTTQEVDLKGKLLGLMHGAGKTEYRRGNISVVITPEGEKVKVRVREQDDLPKTSVAVDAPAAPAAAPAPAAPAV